MEKKLLIIILLGFIFVISACTSSKTVSEKISVGQTPLKFEKTLTKKVDLDYLEFIPQDYFSKEKWPLMVFLHGAGERGSDLEKLKVHGPPKLVERGEELPFIIISPQCPANERWTDQWYAETIIALINETIKKYNIDEDRVYLTGLSMGGFGTWDLACRYPDKFAAIAPVCGGGNPNLVSKIRNIPTWVFHGAKDNVVLLKYSQDMVEALEQYAGNVKFTVYPEANHDSWTETYNNEELYKWFLSNKRESIDHLILRKGNVLASTGEAYLAVDGKEDTRWESDHADSQWFTISLEESINLKKISIIWENAYCKEYKVIASIDEKKWDDIYTTSKGDGKLDVIEFPGNKYKFVKFDFLKRGTQWGNSIWELYIEK